jgi:hypothetical protein
MQEIQKRVLEKALQQITACGAVGVAITFKEDPPYVWGDIQLAAKEEPKKKRSSPRRRTPQELRDQVAGMKVGDVICVPPPEGFTLDAIQGTISGHGCHVFGNGNFTTLRNKLNNTIECMRTA